MDLKAKYLADTCSDPIEFLRQLRQTTEPIGGGTEYSEDGEFVEYDVSIKAVEKANNAFVEKTIRWFQDFMEYSNLFEYQIPESEQKRVIEDTKNYIKCEQDY